VPRPADARRCGTRRLAGLSVGGSSAVEPRPRRSRRWT
jgi:hypothetical protein